MAQPRSTLGLLGLMRHDWPLRSLGLVASLLAAAVCVSAQPEVSIPAHNRAEQREPPPRPAAASANVLAQALFAAIVADDPAAAAPLFFPRPAFLLVKDIKDPGRYYDQLYRRYEADVHALHARLPGLAGARFERFELSARGGFVKVHEEGNRLPYWAARHNFVYYRSGEQVLRFELRVLITWDDRWYIVHLNEFH